MTEESFVERWTLRLSEWCGYAVARTEVFALLADLRKTPPAVPTLSAEERAALGVVRAVAVCATGYHLTEQSPAIVVLDRLLASPATECHDPSHQTCDPTPASVDEAFMRRWTERLDVNRNEVRRLLEEAGVGVEPAKEQTP